MENTKLWKIIRKMPKGALLHAHMDAMVDFDFLFETLLATPGMHIHCMHAISTSQQLEVAPIKFRFYKTATGKFDGKFGYLLALIEVEFSGRKIDLEF